MGVPRLIQPQRRLPRFSLWIALFEVARCLAVSVPTGSLGDSVYLCTLEPKLHSMVPSRKHITCACDFCSTGRTFFAAWMHSSLRHYYHRCPCTSAHSTVLILIYLLQK